MTLLPLTTPPRDPGRGAGAPDLEKYTELNFHRGKTLDALEAVIRKRRSPAVVALEGFAGSGRRYAVDAVVHRLRRAGRAVGRLRLDLEGYNRNTDRSSLASI